MSALTRRGWDSILAEAVLASGGKNYASYSTRLQYLIYEAYQDIAHLRHHQELETSTTSTLSANASSLNYPADAYLVMAVAELDGNSLPSFYVRPVDVKVLAGSFAGTISDQPQQYASFARTLLFDRKTDVDRNYKIYYIKHPAAPDFATTNPPDTGSQWDAHILDLALLRAAIRDGDLEAAKIYAQVYSDFIDQQLKPLLRDSTSPNLPDASTANRPSGGMQT